MSILDILVYPDVRLKQVSQSVIVFDDSLRVFIQDLEDTLHSEPGAVGIAAPQVGRFERIVIVDVSNKPDIHHHGRLVLITPEIISHSGSLIGRDGRLSVPDYTGNVKRAKLITLKACDEFGQQQTYEMERYEARTVQHEIDHLDGVLFLDHLVSRRDLSRRQIPLSSNPKI